MRSTPDQITVKKYFFSPLSESFNIQLIDSLTDMVFRFLRYAIVPKTNTYEML